MSIYDDPDAWAASIDPREKVGHRHHTVPAFYLQRWASSEVVRVFSRSDQAFTDRNIRDMGIRDYYTFIDVDGNPDSSFETIFSQVEGTAAEIIRGLLNPLIPLSRLSPEEAGHLANFIALQMVRGPRRRRESELLVDWYAKTYAIGKVDDDELADLVVAPHTNDYLRGLGPQAEAMVPYIFDRPLWVLSLDAPLLITSDEPVIVNTAGDHVHHVPDCYLTDADIAAREAKERRKKQKRRRSVGRVVHFAPTQPRGLKQAVEIVFPLSPRTALVYGEPSGWEGTITRGHLRGEEAIEFASKVNDQMVRYALDLVIAHPEHAHFETMTMPPAGPIIQVCDGNSVATAVVNAVPLPLRPQRFRKI